LNAAALALATWSIVAVDPRTREMGVALASCIHVEGFRIEQVAEPLHRPRAGERGRAGSGPAELQRWSGGLFGLDGAAVTNAPGLER
jgi:hypothetical protein